MSSRAQASWKTPTMPVGPLVRRLLQLEPVVEVGLGGRAGHRDRPGVRRLGEQRPERHHQLDAEVVERGEQLGAELAPAHVRLDAAQQHHVAVAGPGAGRRDLRRGPGDPAVPVLVGADRRTVDLEVVELLGVDAPTTAASQTRSGGRPRPRRRRLRRSSPRRPRPPRGRPGRDVLDLDHTSSLVRVPAGGRPGRTTGSPTISVRSRAVSRSGKGVHAVERRT